ncbi:hypothetical protein N9D63_05830 [Opitutales bacterium]|nr:hypothetical protein [Opitutales bacterium]
MKKFFHNHKGYRILVGACIVLLGNHGLLHGQRDRFDPAMVSRPQLGEVSPSRTITPRTSSPRPGASDLGLQRPVSVKRSGLDYFIGFDTKLYYSSNANISNRNSGGIGVLPAGIFQNTFHTGFRLGSYNWGSAAFSPYIGMSYSRLDHFGDNAYEIMDMSSLGLYMFGLVQFPSGWALRPGLSYAQDRKSNDNERIYGELFPNFTLLKTFSLGRSVSILDFSLGHHFTDAPFYSIIGDGDDHNRLELSTRWTVITNIGKLEIAPYARLAFLNYSKGSMEDRKDWMREVGLNLEYPFNKYVSANFFARYISRRSKGGNYNYDYERFDGGGGAGLKAKF